MPLPLLTILVACDAVKPELLDAELDSRDVQIEALEARLATLESTVATQAATIETQTQALAAEQAARVGDVATLGESFDAAVAAQGAALAGHDEAIATLASRADDHDAALDVLDADLAALQVDTALLGLGLSAAETRLSLLESADIAGLETRVGTLEDARAAAGETWSTASTSSSAIMGRWTCAGSAASTWHSVASVAFTMTSDGSVLVAAQAYLDADSWGKAPATRIVVRDAAGFEVATDTVLAGYVGPKYVVRGIQLVGGTYSASYEVSDDCSTIDGGPTTIGLYVYAMSVTTL